MNSIFKANLRRPKRHLLEDARDENDKTCSSTDLDLSLRASKTLRLESGASLTTATQYGAVSHISNPTQNTNANLINHAPTRNVLLNSDNPKEQYFQGHVNHQHAMYLKRLAQEEESDVSNSNVLSQEQKCYDQSLGHQNHSFARIDGVATVSSSSYSSSTPHSSSCSLPAHTGFLSSNHSSDPYRRDSNFQNVGFIAMNQLLGSLHEERRQRMNRNTNQATTKNTDILTDMAVDQNED
uniref:Uncharacterized protein n=1 Tax=Corethron hystrix TaxID=216773 RepID=A0A7S1FW24_9STRA|mmetsp:Transcript_33882/g.78241  ORF Transcript_33882/g.78241 Transcript_33882/m.78241 type:complete len:239 (+) Transcript_33882:46-762(+)